MVVISIVILVFGGVFIPKHSGSTVHLLKFDECQGVININGCSPLKNYVVGRQGSRFIPHFFGNKLSQMVTKHWFPGLSFHFELLPSLEFDISYLFRRCIGWIHVQENGNKKQQTVLFVYCLIFCLVSIAQMCCLFVCLSVCLLVCLASIV